MTGMFTTEEVLALRARLERVEAALRVVIAAWSDVDNAPTREARDAAAQRMRAVARVALSYVTPPPSGAAGAVDE
jgi:hypothetical protein